MRSLADVDASDDRRRSMRRARGFVVLALAAALTGCGAPVLTPAGPVASGDRQVLIDALMLMLTIVLPTIGATLLFAWWFRASNPRAKRRPDFTYDGRVELLVWTVPLLTIMFLGGLTWVASHKLDPATPLPSQGKPLEVQVVALDWKWLFILPDQGIASVNTLTVPAGRPLHFSLTSASVMNAFFVPQLGSQIYTMNGMSSQLNLKADRPGDYFGLSSHFSGDGFPGMHFLLHATDAAAFDAAVTRAKAGGPALDVPAYTALARQSADVKPFTYRAVDPALYEAVVSQRIAPAPGPRAPAKGPPPEVFPKPLEAARA